MILGGDRELAVRVLPPHLADLAVAVEVVEAVLVHLAVAVVVERALPASRTVGGIGRVEPVRTAVRVDRGNDVEDLLIGQAAKELDPVAILGQVPDQVERCLGALDLVPVDVAVHIHRRLGSVVTRPGVVDRHAPQLTSFGALSQAPEREQFRVGRDQLPEDLRQLGIVVKPVECNRNLGRRCDGQGR